MKKKMTIFVLVVYVPFLLQPLAPLYVEASTTTGTTGSGTATGGTTTGSTTGTTTDSFEGENRDTSDCKQICKDHNTLMDRMLKENAEAHSGDPDAIKAGENAIKASKAQISAHCGAYTAASDGLIMNGVMEGLAGVGAIACGFQCWNPLDGKAAIACGVAGGALLAATIADMVIMSEDASKLTDRLPSSTAASSSGTVGVPGITGSGAAGKRAADTTKSTQSKLGGAITAGSAVQAGGAAGGYFAATRGAAGSSAATTASRNYSIVLENPLFGQPETSSLAGDYAELPVGGEDPIYMDVGMSPDEEFKLTQETAYDAIKNDIPEDPGSLAGSTADTKSQSAMRRAMDGEHLEVSSTAETSADEGLAKFDEPDPLAQTDAENIELDRMGSDTERLIEEEGQNVTKRETAKAESRFGKKNILPCAMWGLNLAMVGAIGYGIHTTRIAKDDACSSIHTLLAAGHGITDPTATGSGTDTGTTTGGSAGTTTGNLGTTTGGGQGGNPGGGGSTTGSSGSTTSGSGQSSGTTSGSSSAGGDGAGTQEDATNGEVYRSFDTKPGGSNGNLNSFRMTRRGATEGEITASLEKYLSGDPSLAQQGGFAAKFAERHPPRPDVVMGFLNQRGMTLADLSHQVMSEEGAAGWMKGIPSLPPAMLSRAEAIDEQVKRGNIKLPGFRSFGSIQAKEDTIGVNDKKLSSVKLPPMPQETARLLRTLASVPVPAALKPVGGASLGLSDQYDIWHTHWTQSLFEIVSDRLKLARGRPQKNGHSMK